MGGSSRGRVKRIAWFVTVVLLALGAILAWNYQGDIRDYVRASEFSPSKRVQQVEAHIELTDAGRRVFLASQPTVDGSQRFNRQCAAVDHAEGGHVLGCYADSQIHLYEVTDERISGVVEVTAAHELLHAVWARMDDSERSEASRLLMQAYNEIVKSDDALKDRMSVYEDLGDAEFANELHSVLGTEVEELPEALEAHYAEWFDDRHAVTDYFDGYQSVFQDLQDQADSLQKQLTDLKDEVQSDKKSYENDVKAYNSDVKAFNARNHRYEFSEKPDEFRAQRHKLEKRRKHLEAEYGAIEKKIKSYDTKREKLQKLSDVNNDLDDQLNSDLAPPSTRPSS